MPSTNATDSSTPRQDEPSAGALSRGPILMVGGLVPLVHACRILGLTYHQAYGRMVAGTIPGERIDGKWFVPLSAIQQMAEQPAGAA